MSRKPGAIQLRRGLPFHTNRIIYTSYPTSKDLAELAKTDFESNGTNKISTFNLRQLQEEKPTESAASLVISACIADPSELFAINRELREKQPKGNTTYLSPIIRYSNKKERDRLISNLTFGELGSSTFSLFRAKEIKLPRCEKNHSWRSELGVLRRMHAWLERSGKEMPSQIDARILKLENSPAIGLSEDLFWESPNGKPLKIRPDFTFLDTNGGDRQISQADIFVVISAVLNELREGLPKKRKLVYRPFERSVISPDNFQRFNDGVIQASILRAARNYELCFANCPIDLSKSLFDLLENKLSKSNWVEAEAITEFMLAILLRRLTLYPQHEQQLCELISNLSSCPDYLKIMAEYHLLSLKKVL